jgi:adenosylcobyric acid synthase
MSIHVDRRRHFGRSLLIATAVFAEQSVDQLPRGGDVFVGHRVPRGFDVRQQFVGLLDPTPDHRVWRVRVVSDVPDDCLGLAEPGTGSRIDRSFRSGGQPLVKSAEPIVVRFALVWHDRRFEVVAENVGAPGTGRIPSRDSGTQPSSDLATLGRCAHSRPGNDRDEPARRSTMTQDSPEDRASEHTPARTLLVAGTASHVGKSTVAAGLCRLLADRGIAVAPFKAQNMSNNARAVPRSDAVVSRSDAAVSSPADVAERGGVDDQGVSEDDAFGEIGVSQYVQARAARVRPTTDHNPVLLKPRGGGESQLVIDGEAVGHYSAGSYYDDHWERARDAALAAHDRLASAAEVVVAEGAGSIAEINLHDRDLANVELARHADADILLVADIERGGVFASLVGTLELLPADLRERVVGAVVTKFRGDRALLKPGIEAFTDRTGVPVLGVVPYDDPGLPEEDSVGLPSGNQRQIRGGDDGVPEDRTVTVAVPRLPRLSNATDLEPLAAVPGVRVAYVPLESTLADVDAVVLPGTKNTVDDLRTLRTADFDETLRTFDGPIVGLCGGYQLLGQRLTGVASESVDADGELPGVGLLPVETRFAPEKRVVATTLELFGTGPLAGADCGVEGYEIHAGRTRACDELALPFSRPDHPPTPALGAATDSVLGTYLHGLFENRPAREAFVDAVYDAADRERPEAASRSSSPHDHAADLLREWVDVDVLGFEDL